jgi:hypothetical protein
MKFKIHIPRIDIWTNRPLTSWYHGDRVNPNNWPWYVLFRTNVVNINYRVNPKICPCRFYKRFYIYTRNKAYDLDIRVE